MPILAQIILAVISFALAFLFKPRIPSSVATTSEAEEAEMPTVEEGVEIPVFFGIVWSSDSTVVWWGDLKTEETEIDV